MAKRNLREAGIGLSSENQESLVGYEVLEGGDMIVVKGIIDEDEALELASQICQALGGNVQEADEEILANCEAVCPVNECEVQIENNSRVRVELTEDYKGDEEAQREMEDAVASVIE